MRRAAAVSIAIFVVLSALSAMDVRDTVEAGLPLVGTVEGDSEGSLLLYPVELRDKASGALVAATRLFRLDGRRYGFILGVPPGTPAGGYVVSAAGEEASVTVAPREYRRERVALDATLSDLLAREDPIKTAEERALERLLARFEPESLWTHGPFRLPAEGFRRSSLFGEVREYRLADGSTTISMHRGVDLALAEGTPVLAPAAGRVVLARPRILSGNSVVLEHLPGVYSLYFHLAEIGVSEGSRVEAGARIGSVGSTGLATGPHLHWEIRVSGVAVDPEAFVTAHQVDMDRLAPAIIKRPASSGEGR